MCAGPEPFIVFSLPRSRSAWLSVLLADGGLRVGHDVGADCAAPADFLRPFQEGMAGTCETGAAFAWPLIRKRLPRARLAVVLRDPLAVCNSLDALGLRGYGEEMAVRYGHLLELAAQPDVFVCRFESLTRYSTCADLFRHCRGQELPEAWWARLNDMNIQIDIQRRIRMLAQGRDRIDALKTQVRAEMVDA